MIPQRDPRLYDRYRRELDAVANALDDEQRWTARQMLRHTKRLSSPISPRRCRVNWHAEPLWQSSAEASGIARLTFHEPGGNVLINRPDIRTTHRSLSNFWVSRQSPRHRRRLGDHRTALTSATAAPVPHADLSSSGRVAGLCEELGMGDGLDTPPTQTQTCAT